VFSRAQLSVLRQAVAEFILTGYPLALRLSNGELLLDPENPPPTATAPPPTSGRRLTGAVGSRGELNPLLARRRLRGGGARSLLQQTEPGMTSYRRSPCRAQ